jgi:hypothetical protein
MLLCDEVRQARIVSLSPSPTPDAEKSVSLWLQECDCGERMTKPQTKEHGETPIHPFLTVMELWRDEF